MSLKLRERSLNAGVLAGEMGTSPWPCLVTPELSLLFFNELWPREPQQAVGFLNRFFRAHGSRELCQVDLRADSRDLLAVLRNRARFGARGPLVSVVVAAHNAATTLGYALDSLLAQTYAALEILVADDGSTDETAEVMKRYAREPRVRLFRSESNQGAYNVRNQLVAQARGEFLAFHDADDWALPCRVATQLRALLTTSARGSLASLLRVGPAGEVRFFKNQRAVRLSRISLLLRRETFAELGGFRPVRVGGDYELAEKLSSTWGDRALVRSKAPLMLSRFAPGSATASLGTESAEDGYAAPIRRAYSQLVFECYRAGRAVSNERFEQRLRQTNNWLAPTALRPF
jgi:glycosyltransferase involved in cell wall biosynthesis